MKILVVGDCHGEKPGIEGEFDAIIATGDICGDSDEARKFMFQAIDEDEEWYDLMGREKARKTVEQSLEEGRTVLEHLASSGKPVFLVPGNWDWTGDEEWDYLDENRYRALVEEFDNVHDLNFSSKELGQYTLIGYGPCSGPEIPQYDDDMPDDEEEMEQMKQEYSENKSRLESLFEDADKPVIFLSHNVPHDTELDRIDNEDSPAHGRHYGSIVVRELVENFSPEVSIAGHMHEGYGETLIGDTLCINAGLHATVGLELNGSVRTEFRPPLN